MKKYIELFKRNLKLVENYFFTTLLQILNSFFYLLIYPYLLKVLGPSNYGLYLFANSISMYFLSFVQFGFDTPALKIISLNPSNKSIHSHTILSILYSKSILFLLAMIFFTLLIIYVDIFRENRLVFILCFVQILSHLLFPTWYFQGIQKMKVITFIQLTLKLSSLPFLFIFVKEAFDLVNFVLILVSTGLIGGIISMFVIFKFESIFIVPVTLMEIKKIFKASLPFFVSNSLNTVKQQTANILVGSNFTMNDVTVYDLAMKIFTVPTVLVSSVNNVLFPRMINSDFRVKLKVINFENVVGFCIIIFFILFGKYIISFLGGNELLEAYLILIILSFSVFTVLSVGAIFYFILIPMNLNRHIVINQFLALLTFLFVSFVGLLIFENLLVIPSAFAIASIMEWIYSYILLYKVKYDK